MSVLFHGGTPGLAPGMILRPPSQTGVKAAADYMPDPALTDHHATEGDPTA